MNSSNNSILNPQFKYTNAVSTDIRKTFQRIREELKQVQIAVPRESEAKEPRRTLVDHLLVDIKR